MPPVKKYSEEELYSELKGRSRLAFEYLYDNYSPALYGVIFNIVRSEETANDVLQEAFVKIWNNIAQYDPAKAKLYTWMINVARNVAIDKLRSKQEKADRILKNDKEFIYQNNSASHTFIDGIGVGKLVENLDEEQKQIIDFLYFKGYTQSETAEELGIPLGTVKSRVRLAITKLRKHFS